MALGTALTQNLTLYQLYLHNAGIGNSSAGNSALAQGLRVQTQLKVLDLSDNCLGENPDKKPQFWIRKKI